MSESEPENNISKSISDESKTRSGSKLSKPSSVGSANSQLSFSEPEPEETYDYRDRMGCVCGVNEREDKTLIRCDRCELYAHAECIGFAEHDLDEIERLNTEWFCPYCVEDCKTSNSSHNYLELDNTSKSNPEDQKSMKSNLLELRENLSAKKTSQTYINCVQEIEFEPPLSCSLNTSQENNTISINRENSIFLQIPTDSADTEDLVVKPGKNWRRSLSSNISRGLNFSQTRRTTMTSLNYSTLQTQLEASNIDFAVPAVPTAGMRKSKRLSTRRSSWLQLRKSTVPQTLLEEDETEDNDEPEQNSENKGDFSSRKVRSSFYIVQDESKVLEESGLSETSILLQSAPTDLEKLLSKCSKNNIVEFGDIYDEECMASSRKVGEGAFGEVYLIGASSGENPVLKVVPIGGTVKVNDEEQTSLADMMSEVVISTSLSNLRINKLNNTVGKI